MESRKISDAVNKVFSSGRDMAMIPADVSAKDLESLGYGNFSKITFCYDKPREGADREEAFLVENTVNGNFTGFVRDMTALQKRYSIRSIMLRCVRAYETYLTDGNGYLSRIIENDFSPDALAGVWTRMKHPHPLITECRAVSGTEPALRGQAREEADDKRNNLQAAAAFVTAHCDRKCMAALNFFALPDSISGESGADPANKFAETLPRLGYDKFVKVEKQYVLQPRQENHDNSTGGPAERTIKETAFFIVSPGYPLHTLKLFTKDMLNLYRKFGAASCLIRNNETPGARLYAADGDKTVMSGAKFDSFDIDEITEAAWTILRESLPYETPDAADEADAEMFIGLKEAIADGRSIARRRFQTFHEWY